MSFASLGLSEALARAVEAAGYTQPTPVQQRAIPAVLQGRDLMVAAQTGTGKTAGFALPVLERLFPGGLSLDTLSQSPRQARVLVLTPTRELAAQVHDSFQLYARDLPLKSTCIFGGVGMNPQIQALSRGVDVLVACPGRLLDLANQDKVDLSKVEILVLDEADRMLDMGFIHDVKKVLARLPAQRQNLLFSATFSREIISLANKLLHEPERIEVTPPNTTVERIEQAQFKVAATHKRALLAHLVSQGWEQVLVFTRTKHGANRLSEYLNKHGLPAAPIHGNKSQNARTKALADFKSGAIRLLVATDIAARGLDIDQLPHVVNFELPNVEEDYVHRIGRTGRAGRSGLAVSLVSPDEEKLLKAIERLTKQQIPLGDDQGFDPEVSLPEVAIPEPREPSSAAKAEGDAPAKSAAGKRRRKRPAKPGEGSDANAKPQAARPEEPRAKPARQGKPQRKAQAPNNTQAPSSERDPEEFLDDDYDNFGNRADYVSPYENAQKSRGRRQGQGQGQANGSRPRSQGQPAARSPAASKPQGAGKPRSNGGGRQKAAAPSRGYREISTTAPVQEAARKPERKPLIIHKESRLSPEMLEELPGRRERSEKPALLTRNRS